MSIPLPKQPHFVLVPLLAQGHMIPMIDMARLFAERGVIVSLVTTPANALRFTNVILRAQDAGLCIRLVEIPLPCQEAGLPIACENLDSVPSRHLIRNFFSALWALQAPLEKYLENQNSPPTCIISDKCLSWTSDMAKKFGIPRLVFHGMCAFSLLCSHNVKLHNAHLSVSSDSQLFQVPGIPEKVEITRAKLPGAFIPLPNLDDIRDHMRETELSSDGVVMNTFMELEARFIDEYQKAIGKQVWCIGPVSLCNKEFSDKFERGNKASIDEKQCIGWLDSMKPRSVLYACLGSQCRLVPQQLFEIGLALEASNRPFIWVINAGDQRFSEVEKWLVEEKFEERLNGRGLLIKGWAPQVVIISHPAIKAFLTHCGWNSTLEAICSGVPMITWPMFAEQFLNENLIVDILRVGVRVGVEVSVRWGDEEKVGVLMKREDIKRSIERLMNEGQEEEDITARALELAALAKRSIEQGGSSSLNMSLLIQDIQLLSVSVIKKMRS